MGKKLSEVSFQYKLPVKNYVPRHRFWLCMHSDLDLWVMAFGRNHDTPFGHWQQLCEILSKSNKAVRRYGPDTEFGYACTVTLTLDIWPLVKVITHPWVMGQHLCEILSKCNEVVRSYGRTRILAMSRPWVKVMTYNWVTDNTCVKYYWNQTWQ